MSDWDRPLYTKPEINKQCKEMQIKTNINTKSEVEEHNNEIEEENSHKHLP